MNSHSPARTCRLASVIASLNAGGIGPVCRYAAEGIARRTGWPVTLLSLHDPPRECTDSETGLRTLCLGLDGNCARLFLNWLRQNPQDVVITSDVSRIEPAFPILPPETRHIVQIHDSGRRYRAVAVRNAPFVDGVTCVGRHIETRLRPSLTEVGFHGLLGTIHNGANFPPLKPRASRNGPLRLLFMGRVEALKGVFDFVPLLQRLRRLKVPVGLNIVGGENETLRRQFHRKGLQSMVNWTGRVPHAGCYGIAADSDILLVASRKESFGMVTIEAMSMGCVPIAYNIPSGSTEIIEHNKSGLLVPLGDIRAWAETIRQLEHDRERLAALSSAAIARARKTFNAETMAYNMVTFVDAVMKNSRTRPARRQVGLPAETPLRHSSSPRGYQRLPASLRQWICNRIGALPSLSYWWLNR